MKKQISLLFAVFLCCSTISWAQNPEESKMKDEFYKTLNSLRQEKKQALDKKDYAKVEQCNWDIIDNYKKLPEAVQKGIELNYGYYYYDIACYQSLQKKNRRCFVNNFVSGFSRMDISITLIYRKIQIWITYATKRNSRKHWLKSEKKEIIFIFCKKTAEYTSTPPHFTYMEPSDSNLIGVKEYFKLDSVAGTGDELSKIKNILTFIHNKIKHDGQHNNPEHLNSIALAEACKDGSRGLNCRGLATVLNECYLAMGFKSRFITCMPKKYISDCHVINAVYSKTLDKWVWVDPTQNAWVMDENGTMLSIPEVRERMRTGLPLVLNKEANWNNKQKPLKKSIWTPTWLRICIILTVHSVANSVQKTKSITLQTMLPLCRLVIIMTWKKVPTSLMMPTGSGNHHIRNKNRLSILSKQTTYSQ